MKKPTAILCLTLAVLLGSAGVSFALPPCPEDQNQRYHNCFGTLTHASGNKYVGGLKDNKRHGQGTLTFSNGRKYVGEWKGDRKNGQGIEYLGDGKAHKEGI